jgi:hypothetical protein
MAEESEGRGGGKGEMEGPGEKSDEQRGRPCVDECEWYMGDLRGLAPLELAMQPLG